MTPDQDALIRQAADLEDTTVTAFQDLVLSNEAFDAFIAELDRPAKPAPELVELFKKNPKLREG